MCGVLLIDMLFVGLGLLCMPISCVALHVSGTPKLRKSPWPLGVSYVRAPGLLE